MNKLFLILAMACAPCALKAQLISRIFGLGLSEYGSTNLNDSSYHSITPSLNWDGTGSGQSTFDPQLGRYIYRKDGGLVNDTLIVIEAISGNVLQKITIGQNVLNEIQYYTATHSVYGLGLSEYGSVNLDDSTYTTISTDLNWDGSGSGQSTFDPQLGRYIYRKDGGLVNDTLIVIEAISGNVLQKITIGQNVLHEIQYYTATHSVYGLGLSEYGSVNLDDSTYSTISTDLNWDGSGSGQSTFDPQLGRYIYRKDGDLANDTLVVVKAINGNILQKIPVDQYTLTVMQYDRTQGLSSVDGAENTSNAYTLYPNPAGSYLYVRPEKNDHDLMLYIYDTKGSILYEKKHTAGSGFVTIETGNLLPGIYILKMISPAASYSPAFFIKQ